MIIFYPDLFMEISIDLLVMWLKVYIWDHILSRPVYGNFHNAVSAYPDLFMEISIDLLVML